MSCCRTWTHRTSPAIATTTFYRSSKTTEAFQTHKLFWPPAVPVLDKHKDALPFSSSSCTVFIGQRRVTERSSNSDTTGSFVAILLNCAAILSWLFYTQVLVCTLGTCCSIFYSYFCFSLEKRNFNVLKKRKTTEKYLLRYLASVRFCPCCYSNLRGHSFLVSQLHSLTGLVSRSVVCPPHIILKHKRLWQCKKNTQLKKKFQIQICPW